MEGPRGAPQPYLDLGLEEIFRVVPAVPEEMGPGPDPHGSPWELLTWAAVAVCTLLLFLWRSVQCVRSRLYLKRERKLALKLSKLIEEKCKLLDKVSLLEKEYKGLEASLQDVNSEKESKEAKILEVIHEILNMRKSNGDKILFLEKELKEEVDKHSEQEELMADTSERIKSLEEDSKSLKLETAEAKTTLRISQVDEDRLQGAIKEALSKNSQLEASQRHLVEEAEGWKAKVSALVKEKTTFENSKVHVEEILHDEEKPIKSLTERVKIRDWDPALTEDLPGDGNLLLEEEKRLSEIKKRIRHAAEELETCKKQAKGLEDEVDSTYRFYQRQIIAYEEKAREKTLAPWVADKNLNNLRQVNAYNTQKLAELDFKLKLLEQDPDAFVLNTTFSRQPSPNGNHHDNSNKQVPSLPEENQASGRGFLFSPLAPIRGPLLPGDPGSKFLRGGPGFPPPPPRNLYGEITGPLMPMDPRSLFLRRGPFLPPPPPRNISR